jgi:hypothetical protein
MTRKQADRGVAVANGKEPPARTMRYRGRALPLLALVFSVAAGPLAAQKWVDSRYPYLTSGSNDFPMLAVRQQWNRPVKDYFDSYAYAGNLSLDGGMSLRGSYFLTAEFRAPGLKPGWRFVGLGGATREARFGFFGLGNNTTFDEALSDQNQPFLYRVRQKRLRARGEVTRWLRPHVGLALAVSAEHNLLSALPGPSIFRSSFSHEVEDNDITGGLSLIVDTRDNEFNTTRGVLLEAGAMAGSGGNGYQRYYGAVDGFVSLREGTVVAARLVGAGMTGSPPLHARFELPMWERSIKIYGGQESNRGFDEGRFAGRDVLFGNLEIRHNILDLVTLGSVGAVAFVDAGRVFEQEGFRLTTEDLKVGGGAGIALRFLRSTIFTFNVAKGDDGWNFTMTTGWLF